MLEYNRVSWHHFQCFRYSVRQGHHEYCLVYFVRSCSDNILLLFVQKGKYGIFIMIRRLLGTITYWHNKMHSCKSFYAFIAGKSGLPISQRVLCSNINKRMLHFCNIHDYKTNHAVPGKRWFNGNTFPEI